MGMSLQQTNNVRKVAIYFIWIKLNFS